jgi:hypothetical protein
MTRAISRDSFNELKQYQGVHLQQGRVILDSDWNEAQDINATMSRRLGQDAFYDGVLNEGFGVEPVLPVPWGPFEPYESTFDQGGLPLLLKFPQGQAFDTFDSADNWALSAAQGRLRISRDRPYEGKNFLRVTDHGGVIQVTKTLPNPVDLSAFQYAHYRFRLNQTLPIPPAAQPGTASFFIEDVNGNRNIWRIPGIWNARDMWTPGTAMPLDLRFHLVDLDLQPAYRTRSYTSVIVAIGAPAAVTWSITAGSLPPGVSLTNQTNTHYGLLTGTPTGNGTFTFTVNASSSSQNVTRQFTLRVQDAPAFPTQTFDSTFNSNNLKIFWDDLKTRMSIKTPGTAANLAQIKKYGFEIFQTSPTPMIWDFDALHFSSRTMITSAVSNNFVISGSLQRQVIDYMQMRAAARDFGWTFGADTGSQAIASQTAGYDRLPRAYVGGLACTQPRDVLYQDQADPNDPPLTTPSGALRKDLVYLDVWREPVTYIEDPDLREIALGGPDTTTRMRVRQRVRVTENWNGVLPGGDGTGQGTLATEGTYTDRTNRLYLVEVDRAGDIGTATVRWSEDNGSTIQRVIEALPPGSTKVKVEDASAFQPGDFILIRKEFGDEQHQIAGIFGNTITLQQPTGTQLALLPAGVRNVPGFTTFALADRPKVQRWNAFGVPIVADSNDSTISAAIDLSRGVKIRLGGRALRKGDYWTFRTRYLAGDDASGINAAARIETVDFLPPQGVVHHYTPLALLLRDPAAHEPDRIKVVRDLRRRAGRIAYHHGRDIQFNITGGATFSVGTVDLGVTSTLSCFLCTWSGVTAAGAAGTIVNIDFAFFNHDAPNPDTSIAGLRLLGSTTMFCESTGVKLRGASVFVTQEAGQRQNGEWRGLVTARALLTLQGAGSLLGTGRLDIIEIKPVANLIDLINAGT